MNRYLWQPDGGAPVDEIIMRFLAGEDVLLDRELFPYDIRATAAHVRGLARIGILAEAESGRLVALLEELLQDFQGGRFVLDERFEEEKIEILRYAISSCWNGTMRGSDNRGHLLQIPPQHCCTGCDGDQKCQSCH